MPTIAELRAELDQVRALEAVWKARGAPEPEGAGIRAKVAAAEASIANAVNTDSGEIEMEPENMRRGPNIEMEPDFVGRPSGRPNGVGSPTPVAHAHASKVAHKRSQHKPPRQTRSSKEVLNHETDARFWAQSGYKVGQKLDPHNPADRAMTKLWLDIFHKIEAEDATGHLVTTFDHPEVTAHLQEATVARQAAEQHLEQAAAAPDPWEQTRNIEAAATANAASQKSADQAAKFQPPTASPHVAQTAARDAHAAAKKPPPGVIVFPKGHPVHHRPSAQPAHPAFNTPNAPEPQGEAPPLSPSDHLALGNAAAAPGKVAELHAQDEPSGGELPKFPSSSEGKPGKKKMSTGKIALIATGAVAAVGGIGYAVYRGFQSPKGPSGTFRMPRMPGTPR